MSTSTPSYQLQDTSPTPAACPVCGEPTDEIRDRLPYCRGCEASWLPCYNPREYAEANNLTPYEARTRLLGRRPWHYKGHPIVPGTRRPTGGDLS